jgi:hypothetical protein
VGIAALVPIDGPPEVTARRFKRVGLVHASVLTEPLTWTSGAGDELRGEAGDWRVTDDAGDLRTVSDAEFRSSHEPAGGGRWRRVGVYLAWQVSETAVISTREGDATARPGDWVVQAPSGDRWPVKDDQFRRTYSACQPEGAG